jgi:hypothetical protein
MNVNCPIPKRRAKRIYFIRTAENNCPRLQPTGQFQILFRDQIAEVVDRVIHQHVYQNVLLLNVGTVSRLTTPETDVV